MSEIPADILASAENALDNLLCNCREAGDVRQDSIRDIAKAILAERERCAQIAYHFPKTIMHLIERPGGPPGNIVRASTGQDIAVAIASRSPSTPPEGREQNT